MGRILAGRTLSRRTSPMRASAMQLEQDGPQEGVPSRSVPFQSEPPRGEPRKRILPQWNPLFEAIFKKHESRRFNEGFSIPGGFHPRRTFRDRMTTFIGTDFSNANLSEANLRGADLRKKNLSGVDLHRTILSEAGKASRAGVGFRGVPRALAVKASRVATGSLTRHEVRTVFRRRGRRKAFSRAAKPRRSTASWLRILQPPTS
jgi:hypothetical protein